MLQTNKHYIGERPSRMGQFLEQTVLRFMWKENYLDARLSNLVLDMEWQNIQRFLPEVQGVFVMPQAKDLGAFQMVVSARPFGVPAKSMRTE